jgi:hypothetical protein
MTVCDVLPDGRPRHYHVLVDGRWTCERCGHQDGDQ